MVVEVRAEDLDADVGPHAGREHLDPVDDRLGEDVAPAGHLQDAAHLVIDQVALRPAGPRPQEHAGRGTASPARPAGRRTAAGRAGRAACRAGRSWPPSANRAASAPRGAPSSRSAASAALTDSSRAYQVNASVPRSNSSQLICLTRSRQSRSPLGLDRPEHLAGEGLAARPSNSPRPPRRRASSRPGCERAGTSASPDQLARRPARPATPAAQSGHVLQGRVSGQPGAVVGAELVGQVVDLRPLVAPAGQLHGRRGGAVSLDRRSASASGPARARTPGSRCRASSRIVSSNRSRAFWPASLTRSSRSSAAGGRARNPSPPGRPARRASAGRRRRTAAPASASSSCGRKLTNVSTMSSGAGSVGVSARPPCRSTDSTSGKPRSRASRAFRSSAACVTLARGTVTGMSSIVPSSSGGMNATPIFGK